MHLFVLCVVSITLGALGAWAVSRFAEHLGLIDHPSARSSHTQATPKGGGSGIFLAVIAVSALSGVSPLVWLSLVAVGAISLIGDHHHLSQAFRLVVQSTAATIAIASVLVTSGRLAGSPLPLQLCFVGAAAAFAVGTANYYNFMDGINGIAGIMAIIAFSALTCHVRLYGVTSTGLPVTIPLAAVLACVGFLPFNIPSARVFMGDVGSITLGMAYAVWVVSASSSLTDFICLAGYLFMFYADEITTVIARLISRENLLHPHRRHAYQILANQYEWPHWLVSLSYGLAQAALATALLILRPHGPIVVLLLIVAASILFAIFSAAVRRSESNVTGKMGAK